jgi:hypothetical protein
MQKFISFLLLVLFLVGCGGSPATQPQIIALVPYSTVSPGQSPTIIQIPFENPLPTLTPYYYSVIQGDTLESIARSNGISVESLIAFNPDISTAVLSIGTKLLIPPADENTKKTEAASPTPVHLAIRQARCWPETSGGLWCFALFENDFPRSLENLSAAISLLDASGRELSRQVIYGLLDIYPPGKFIPLAAHFPPPTPEIPQVSIQVLTANWLLPGDNRYVPVNLENTLVVNTSARSAQLSGLVISAGTETASGVWIQATAYDDTGYVVGIRRWEYSKSLIPGSPVPFNFMISSAGPVISRVDFIAEARH